MTRTPLSGSKGQRSRSPDRFTHDRFKASGIAAAVSAGTFRSARRRKAPTEGEGRGHIVSPRAQLVVIVIQCCNEKSAPRRKHCALRVVKKAGAKNVSPRRRPPSRGRGTAKTEPAAAVTTFIYRPSSVKIDARNFESCHRGIRPTKTQTQNAGPPARCKQLNRQDR